MPRPRKHPDRAPLTPVERQNAYAKRRLAAGVSRKYVAAGPELQAKIDALRETWDLATDAAVITRAIEVCHGIGIGKSHDPHK